MSRSRRDLDEDLEARRQVVTGSGDGGEDEYGDGDEDDDRPRAPWHFKLMLVGTVLYLIYRLIWFVFWLTGHAWHG